VAANGVAGTPLPLPGRRLPLDQWRCRRHCRRTNNLTLQCTHQPQARDASARDARMRRPESRAQRVGLAQLRSVEIQASDPSGIVRRTPGSSSGGGFHPPALTEPDVRLSPHPALPLQPHWPCRGPRLLPSLVGHAPRPKCRAPSLPPRYQASSLLRARPSLRPALVLGSSWVHHLEISLGIEAQVPAFRTRARAGLTPPLCRPPPEQQTGRPPGLSQATYQSPVSMASTRFRHVADGSLSFVFPAHT
jgi:hypothetical protein